MRRYFDTFGDAERDRLSGDVAGRVSLEVHRRFLARFVRPGDRVLEVGAGPGRFTAELAALGASIVVTDLSPVQLALNEERLRGGAAEASVERRAGWSSVRSCPCSGCGGTSCPAWSRWPRTSARTPTT